jgi:hypothetical protein
MPSFSQRKGLKPLQNLLQIDSIDGPLRNRLWNAMHDFVMRYARDRTVYEGYSSDALTAQNFARRVWCDFFKLPTDDAPSAHECETPIKQLFSDGEWNEVYDLLEFSLVKLPPNAAKPLAKRWNELLQEENAGYRIVDGQVVSITSPEEIGEIETALATDVVGMQEHIHAALAFLSDRENPNYRNSIKESISAVESVCRLIGGGQTLGDALKGMREKIQMHPAIEKGFNSLYGYTSDKGGIRHALLEESSVDSTDARFMLVACSAFVNFVVAKAANAGIKLG